MFWTDWPVDKTWNISLIDNGCGRAHFTKCESTPGLAVLGALRKQAEESLRNNAVSSFPPGPLSQPLLPCSCSTSIHALIFLSDVPWRERVSWNKSNPFLLKLLYIMVFYGSHRNPQTRNKSGMIWAETKCMPGSLATERCIYQKEQR